MTDLPADKEQTFGIGAVSKFTGLSDHTIRVWERRYQAVVARRASNGRRLYTAKDIEKLNVLKQLTDSGVSIGRIAGESLETLVERAGNVRELSSTPAPKQINVAALGDFLPARFQHPDANLAPLNVVVAETSEEHFLAEVTHHRVDVIVMELPALGGPTLRKVRQLMAGAGVSRAVFIYTFGRSADIEQLRSGHIIVLRSPVTIDELQAAIQRCFTGGGHSQTKTKRHGEVVNDADWAFEGAIEPRRFGQNQLAMLANVSSTIDCECPQHLVELVSSLNAFEVYSANCANRNDEDAALHRYLHRTTAQARSMIEAALERVAKAENLL